MEYTHTILCIDNNEAYFDVGSGFITELLTPTKTKQIIGLLQNFCNNHSDEQIETYNKQCECELYAKMHEHIKPKRKNKPGYVYVLECENKYKIGFSRNVDRRKIELDTRPFKTTLLYKKFFKNGYKVEQTIHKLLKDTDYNVCNEWYDFKDDIETIIHNIDSLSEEELCYDD